MHSAYYRLFIIILGLVPALAQAADVNLAWDASNSPGVAGYRMHHGDTPGTYTATQDAGIKTTGSINSLIPGQQYFLAVTAYDTDGNQSPYSNEVAYRVPDLVPVIPVTPTQLRAVPLAGCAMMTAGDPQYNAMCAPRIILKWAQPVSSVAIAIYAIYKSLPAPVPSWVLVRLHPYDPQRLRWTDSAILPGVEWCYMVQALGVTEESQNNPVACGIVP